MTKILTRRMGRTIDETVIVDWKNTSTGTEIGVGGGGGGEGC